MDTLTSPLADIPHFDTSAEVLPTTTENPPAPPPGESAPIDLSAEALLAKAENQPVRHSAPGDGGLSAVGSAKEEKSKIENPSTVPRRPRGKIARLLPPLREKLNQLLDEGLTYPEIITRLAPDVQGLNEQDLCRWYKSGHQDWLKNQLWLDQTRSRLDFALDVISEHEGGSVHHANLHVAATQLIHDLLANGQKLLAEHPEHYVSLVNSVSRLSREALNYQKYREACALARTEVDKLKDPNHKPTEAETLAIVDRLDEILGFK